MVDSDRGERFEKNRKRASEIFDAAEEIFHQARKYFGNPENSKLEDNAFISKISLSPSAPFDSSWIVGPFYGEN